MRMPTETHQTDEHLAFFNRGHDVQVRWLTERSDEINENERKHFADKEAERPSS